MKPIDFEYFDKKIKGIKDEFFFHVNESGPEYEFESKILLKNIRNYTGRKRLTQKTLNEYKEYIVNRHGIKARIQKNVLYDIYCAYDSNRESLIFEDMISLKLNVNDLITYGDESLKLKLALDWYKKSGRGFDKLIRGDKETSSGNLTLGC